MSTFAVFASYAHADRERHLERFVEDVRKGVRSLLGEVDSSTLVFFDRQGVRAGDPWESTILEAVRTSKVLVCLMSPTYFKREWCGRELEVFMRRQANLPAGTATTFIFPIWWQLPLGPRRLPSKLGRLHFGDGGFPPQYEELGVRGLARESRWTQFRRMVDQLAQRIGETLQNGQDLPIHPAIATVADIENAFDEEEPYDVRILALANGGRDWRPSASDTSVAESAANVAQLLQVFIRPLGAGYDLEQQLLDAQSREQVLLVVVDAAEVANAVLKTVDKLLLPNLALLLVDAGTPAIGLEVWLAQRPKGAFSRAHASGLARAAAPGALAVEMERLVDEARRRLRASRSAARAEDTLLAEAARQRGIAVDVQPQLTGPGSEGRR